MARSFTAQNDKIDFGTSSTLNPAAVTLSCWAYVPTFTFIGSNPADAYVCGRNQASPLGAYNIYLTSGAKVFWIVNAASGAANYTGSTSLSTNTWYSLILTYNNVAGTLGYINGAADGAGTGPNGALGADVGGHFQMGDDAANASTFNSTLRIANVGVWNTILTAGEISALANGALPSSIRPGSLIGYFPVSGLQSPEPDLSGNANNGTLTGTANASGPPIMQFTPRWQQLGTFTFPDFSLVRQIGLASAEY